MAKKKKAKNTSCRHDTHRLPTYYYSPLYYAKTCQGPTPGGFATRSENPN